MKTNANTELRAEAIICCISPLCQTRTNTGPGMHELLPLALHALSNAHARGETGISWVWSQNGVPFSRSMGGYTRDTTRMSVTLTVEVVKTEVGKTLVESRFDVVNFRRPDLTRHLRHILQLEINKLRALHVQKVPSEAHLTSGCPLLLPSHCRNSYRASSAVSRMPSRCKT